MASEMIGSYDLLVPLMLAEAATLVLLRRFTLYEKQVPTRRDSPAHGAEYVLDLLQHIRVRDAFQPQPNVVTVHASTPLEPLLRKATASTQAVFPMVSERGELQGIVTIETLRSLFFDEDIGKLAIAADCATPWVDVAPDDTLADALARFASSHYAQLPVVAAESGRSGVLGLLSYEELLEAYSREMMRRRHESEPPASA
jgi:CIC family chloride channel protein